MVGHVPAWQLAPQVVCIVASAVPGLTRGSFLRRMTSPPMCCELGTKYHLPLRSCRQGPDYSTADNAFKYPWLNGRVRRAYDEIHRTCQRLSCCEF
ncbi:hypothetical protein EV401DRAFT_1341427 [Pisolithus croceorrhizus]|nr:hypothetical protein EV401DRAFT_1341427 [Pisolithus croceorrhizus]